MEKLRVNQSAIKIEVNDNGECIEVNLRDQRFLLKLQEVISEFESIRPEYERLHAESLKSDDIHRFDNIMAYNNKICEQTKAKIDDVFGLETCRKVFGDIVPSLDMYAEFFEQLTPILHKHNAAAIDKLSKYTSRYKKETEVS